MALIKCVDCGKDISDKAKSCPNCGCPVEDSIQDVSKTSNEVTGYVVGDSKKPKSKKKIIIIVVILVLLFIFVIGLFAFTNISLHSVKCYLFGCSEPVESFYCEYDQNICDIKYNYLVVINEYVNVRSEASRNSSYITKVCSGNNYNVVELKEVDGVIWYKIKYDISSYGWIISSYDGDEYVEYFDLGKNIDNANEPKTTTKLSADKTTTKKKTTKKATSKKSTTKAPIINTTTKTTTTEPAVRSLKIGSKNGVGSEYIYGKNKCTLDSLTVTPEVSKYTGSVKFNVKGKFTKTYNPSSTIGYCSVVVNFYDSTGLKIGSTTLSSSGLAVGESGLANSITYADADIDDIVGDTITVKVSNRA